MIEPRVFRGIGPKREPKERARNLSQEGTSKLPRFERATPRKRKLCCAALIFKPSRKDLNPPEEPGQALNEPRHSRIKGR